MRTEAPALIRAAQSSRALHDDPFRDPAQNPPVPTQQNVAPTPVTPARHHGRHVTFHVPDSTTTPNVPLNPHETPTRTSSIPLSRPALPLSSHASAPSRGVNAQSERDDFTYVFQSPVTPHSSRVPITTAVTPLRTHGHQNHTPRTPRTPRAGRHSATPSRPAGNKNNHKVKDVWLFFQKESMRQHCVFCQ